MAYDEHIPHEYMDEHNDPQLRGLGNNTLHGDRRASELDDMLPIYSTLGRGPRGKGVEAVTTQEDETTFIIDFLDDQSGEKLFSSPNLHAGKVTAERSEDGHSCTLYLTRGTEKKTLCTLTLPQGEQGSRIFAHKTSTPIYVDENYIHEFSASELACAGLENPEPRVWDVVLSYVKNPIEPNTTYFAAGIVTQVSKTAGEVYATVVFHTFYVLTTKGGSLEQQQVDYLQQDTSQVDYIKHRELIQRALKAGKYISLDSQGNIDIQNFAEDEDILSLFK